MACGLGRYHTPDGSCASCPPGSVNVLSIWAPNASACVLSCPSPTQFAATPDACTEAPQGMMPSPGSTAPVACPIVSHSL